MAASAAAEPPVADASPAASVPAPQAVLIGPAEPITNRQPVTLWLTLLNTTPTSLQVVFPPRLSATALANAQVSPITLTRAAPDESGEVTLAPGSFARRAYAWVPAHPLIGTVLVSVPEWKTPALAVRLEVPNRPDPVVIEDNSAVTFSELQHGDKPTGRASFSTDQFFKEHFFGYEPVYFIAGPDSPNVKFQVSLRYQLLNRHGWLAQQAPFLKGLNFAYTQRSLWDLSAPSQTFLDTSYMPEVFYLWQRVDGGQWADWFRLDLQGGVQHESNGRGGLASRSLNMVYAWPSVTFGRPDGFQAKLAPRAWVYVGGLLENPDVPEYRGYGELRLTLGWPQSLQLLTTGRLGEGARHGSVQLDLTYPMMRLFSGSFSLYLHAQYFTGYGESLLLYNERSESWRLGFSLFR